MIYNFLSIGEKLTEIIKDAFSVNLTEFIINILATVILIVIIRFLFWNKVTDFLDKKREEVKKEYTVNEEIKQETLKLEESASKILDETKVKAQNIINDAKETAEIEKNEIISNAKLESERILKDSHELALKEKEEIIKDAKGEVVNLASLIASKMIDEEINQDKYNNKVLEELDDK